MFAIAFDLQIAQVNIHFPRRPAEAYDEIRRTLHPFGFTGIQGSVYISQSEDLVAVTQAMIALKALPWFADCVRDIRAFRVEQWSDFTSFMKESEA